MVKKKVISENPSVKTPVVKNGLSSQTLKQVIGWSVHSEERGILGPLFTTQKGKMYYLDSVDHLGFFPVTLSDKVYKDEN